MTETSNALPTAKVPDPQEGEPALAGKAACKKTCGGKANQGSLHRNEARNPKTGDDESHLSNKRYLQYAASQPASVRVI